MVEVNIQTAAVRMSGRTDVRKMIPEGFWNSIVEKMSIDRVDAIVYKRVRRKTYVLLGYRKIASLQVTGRVHSCGAFL